VEWRGIEVVRCRLPLTEAFRTAHGTVDVRDVVYVRAVYADTEGWGECAALPAPTYTSEWTSGAEAVLREHLAPLVLAAPTGDAVARMDAVAGHPMAKAAVEQAVLDAELRAAGVSLAAHLGAVRDRVPAGAAIGLFDSVDATVAAARRLVADGYRRLKLKVVPGWDAEPVAAVRAAVGDSVALQVDANGAYGRRARDAQTLTALDDLELVCIEQPLTVDAPLDELATLASSLRAPICLDESIGSAADAVAAIEAGACAVVCVKPGRLGGLREAVLVHDECMARDVAVWCGGMLDTGIGRAANLALSALPGFTLAGDLSASARWFPRDITVPTVLDGDGCIAVPASAGVSPAPLDDVLADVATARTWIAAR
jgi:O-succinylbenzoate synthase